MKKNRMKSRIVATFLLAVMLLGVVGCSKTDSSGKDTSKDDSGSKSNGVTVAMLPKFKGENYFDACKTGAEEAAEELDITLLYDGPPQDQATNQKQVDILEGWIAQQVNVIIVSPNDPTAIAPTLKKAQNAGIKIVTFDADAQEDSRDIFVNQITPESAAKGLLDGVADNLKEKGYGDGKKANIALVSSSGTDANQKAWEEAIDVLLETSDYSFMQIKNRETDVYYPGTDETKVNSDSATLIGRMGDGDDKIQAAIGLSSMATPALGAQFQSASSKPDISKISITGLATPNALKTYIKDDENPMNSGVLWNCMDLGYLAVQAAYQLNEGTIDESSSSITAGRIGGKEIVDRVCILGDALVFDSATVDEFDY
ncbi:monosaccharide ABC transporter substrate-binding protein (CUT2 family) [Muricomes intestini]|jgi:ABC-type sugar transport system substrate-binding protein|uniref:Monosaccharide ABC transporter substrate-binding protein (CUT2 family) n=1 Tax=Muricomes intestini TaxID=1796634 RepID=A0A4R3K2B8_9FIRM|nr:autoinducer 2 ABC transporter substrate-binding protein [Muricomes intestini]TCS76399.1 monosaccharide ABC transporter substrate-binding protein (CUT2 family) [Muricomes intestini]